jgi:hypothetical protein
VENKNEPLKNAPLKNAQTSTSQPHKMPATGVQGVFETIEQNIIKETNSWQRRLKRRHRMLYALFTFIGVMLLWYGFWTLISEIPILNNPYLASVLGFVILLVLHQFYDNMVSAGDRRIKKPTKKKN